MNAPRWLSLPRDEVLRRLVHASGTGVPGLYLLGVITWAQLGYVLLAGAALAGVLEVLRLFVGLDWWIYRRLTREYEQDNPAGYALYAFSLAIVGLAFEPNVAIPGMLMLTIGDPISGLLGSAGATSVKKAGVLAVMFGVCWVLAWPFVAAETTTLVAVSAATVGATGATVADGVKPVVAGYVVDDNLSIPLLASGGIWLVLQLAG